MYKSQFEGAEADRRLALIDSINEQLCPKRSGTLPLTIDSIGGNLSDWTIYGNTEGVGERTKNLLKDEWRQGNAQDPTSTVRCCATSVIPTTLGDTFSFGLYNATKRYAIYGINAAGLAEFNQTQTVSAVNRVYNPGFTTENKTVTTEDVNIVAYWVMLAQIEGASPSTIVPDDCKNCIVIVRGTDLPQSYIPYGYQVHLDIHSLSDTNEINFDEVESRTRRGITYTVDKEAGTITANGTAEEGDSGFGVRIYGLSGDFMFSGTPEGGNLDTYYSYMHDMWYRNCEKWDGTVLTENDFDYGKGQHEVHLDNPQIAYYNTIIIKAGYTCNNLVFKPTLIRADISSHKDICTGSTPLTEGQSVSRDSTGI